MDDGSDQPLPVSRGRSVRFEIPEVPPPPSSPQLSDDGQKDTMPSRNTVTVNTSVPTAETGSSATKPMSNTTLRTDVNTVNTSVLPAEASFVRSQTVPTRELSTVSSPEPWPQVNESDFEKDPSKSPDVSLPETSTTTPTADVGKAPQRDNKDVSKNNSNKVVEKKEKEPVKVPVPEKESTRDSEWTTTTEKTENYVNKTPDEHKDAMKKLLDDSRKSESPAPPPPSPEPKQDSNLSNGKKMEPLVEEPDGESEMTVVQIPPTGKNNVGKRGPNRHIDTFQNIDIPAKFEAIAENTTVNETIQEEPEHDSEIESNKKHNEPTADETQENNEKADDVAPSEKSSLANRTITEYGPSDASSPMIEPAMSQVSQIPAMSEEMSSPRQEVFVDWTSVTGSRGGKSGEDGEDNKETEELPLMTEEGGDHEGFKEDLRQEYEKLERETTANNSETN